MENLEAKISGNYSLSLSQQTYKDVQGSKHNRSESETNLPTSPVLFYFHLVLFVQRAGSSTPPAPGRYSSAPPASPFCLAHFTTIADTICQSRGFADGAFCLSFREVPLA